MGWKGLLIFVEAFVGGILVTFRMVCFSGLQEGAVAEYHKAIVLERVVA